MCSRHELLAAPLALCNDGEGSYVSNLDIETTLAIGGVSLLAVVGLIGWTRPAMNCPLPPSPRTSQLPAVACRQPGTGQPRSERACRLRTFTLWTIAHARGIPGLCAARSLSPAYARTRMRNGPRCLPASSHARVYYTTSRGRRRYVVVRKRPFRRSAAIVGGSAAGGALIGALAGGGKGAAIGALAGGGGGLITTALPTKKDWSANASRYSPPRLQVLLLLFGEAHPRVVQFFCYLRHFVGVGFR